MSTRLSQSTFDVGRPGQCARRIGRKARLHRTLGLGRAQGHACSMAAIDLNLLTVLDVTA